MLLTRATRTPLLTAAAFAVGPTLWLVPTVDAQAIDVLNLTIDDVKAGYAAGTFTATQLTNAFFEHIETYEPFYNAYITLDKPGALAKAAEVDAMLGTPGEKPLLFGVPMAIKDPMDVAGLPTTVGSTAFSSRTGGVDIIPETDAPMVKRLRDAGAIFLGKTNVPDFSRTGTHSTSTLEGITRNAYVPSRVPGGSSGGSGVAAATGMAVAAMAEETGSSITNPASAAALVGIRPTFGLIPNTGVFPLQGTFRDVVGPVGKTVRDAVTVFQSIAGPTPEDPKTSVAEGMVPAGGYLPALTDTALQGARIGVYGPGYNNVTLGTETSELFARELAVLTSQGATLVTDPFAGTGFASLQSGIPGSPTFTFDVQAYLARLGPSAAFNSVEEYEALTGRDFHSIFMVPPATSGEDPDTRSDLDPYRQRRADLLALFNQVMNDFDLDAIVMPQLADPVPELGPTGTGVTGIRRTPGAAVNVMGVPGVVVPGGFYADGSPFATYFIGRRFDESTLMGLAYDYEQATMHRVAPVLMVPEPGSVLLLAGSGVLLGLRRRREVTPG